MHFYHFSMHHLPSLSQKKISVAFSSQPLQKDVVTIQAATHVTD